DKTQYFVSEGFKNTDAHDVSSACVGSFVKSCDEYKSKENRRCVTKSFSGPSCALTGLNRDVGAQNARTHFFSSGLSGCCICVMNLTPGRSGIGSLSSDNIPGTEPMLGNLENQAK